MAHKQIRKPTRLQYEKALITQKELKPNFKRIFNMASDDMEKYKTALQVIRAYEEANPEAFLKRKDELLARYNGSSIRLLFHYFKEATASCFRTIVFFTVVIISAIPYCIYLLFKGIFGRRN